MSIVNLLYWYWPSTEARMRVVLDIEMPKVGSQQYAVD